MSEKIKIIINGMVKEVKNPVQGLEIIALAGFKSEDSAMLIIKAVKWGCNQMGRLHYLDYVDVDDGMSFMVHK